MKAIMNEVNLCNAERSSHSGLERTLTEGMVPWKEGQVATNAAVDTGH